MRRRRNLTGQRFGAVVVLDDPATPGGRTALCWCDCGRVVELYRDGLTTGRTLTCGDRWEHSRKPVVTYADAHWRVKRERGPARAHLCVDCGRPAAHCSYDHTDPAELVEPRYFGPAAYSLDVDCYEPRCASCHARVDRAWQSGRELRKPAIPPVQEALFADQAIPPIVDGSPRKNG
ncbi:hypothetical protein AAG589_16165 [Isoptericola sp. F-RaC21]|uniref:hypothetical protein n=1 Tax=Isoptericola sp. F-RaC21 TaxID=3141452 RepID=UPI00315B5F7F